MEPWRKVWRVAVKRLSTPSLVALHKALEEDSPTLLQGATTTPPPLQCVQDWPVEAACIFGFCGTIDSGGFGKATVADAEEFFARMCFDIDQDMGEPAGCRWLLNAYDEWSRQELLENLLPEVRLALKSRRREGNPMDLDLVVSLHQKGSTLKELAGIFGVKTSYLSKKLRSIGYSARRSLEKIRKESIILPDLPPDLVAVPLTKSKFAVVDREDYERVARHQWHVSFKGGNRTRLYAYARIDGKLVSLHSYVFNKEKGVQIDHIDNDGLNCSKHNLRVATRGQNQYNSGKRLIKGKSTSKYKGVTWNKKRKKWVVQITKDKRHYRIGAFTDEEEAARSYDKKALELHGVFAFLNFPEVNLALAERGR